MKNNGILSVALKLFIITTVAALCLAVVNMITEPIIKANNEKSATETKMRVLSKAKEFVEKDFSASDIPNGAENDVTIQGLSVGYDENKTPVGYVITATSSAGYGGDVKLMIGLNPELKVERVEIVESSETPGLGANASKPDFIGQFEGKGSGLEVVKGDADGDTEISAISSATITSKAVTSCVNAATELMESKLKAGFTPEINTEVNEKKAEIEQKTTEQINGETTEQKGDGE